LDSSIVSNVITIESAGTTSGAMNSTTSSGVESLHVLQGVYTFSATFQPISNQNSRFLQEPGMRSSGAAIWVDSSGT